MERKHSDVLIAGLILVGASTWLRALTQQLFVLDFVARGVILFVAAFGAAQFARRLLPELDFGKTAIAAIVSMGIGIGVFAHRFGEPMNVDMLKTIGVALESKYSVLFFAFALIAGLALTPQRRVPERHVSSR